MNLIIDEGNSRAKCSVTTGNGQIIYNVIEDALTVQAVEKIRQQYPQLDKAIYCSVRQDNELVADYLQNTFSRFIRFSHRTPIPLRNLYGTPETLGYDRMAAAVGAWYFFPKNDLMVIDAGTAVTIDFVSRAGEYLGGNISPGITTRFRALNIFTGKLPMGEITPDAPKIGTNTLEAIEAGVLNGIVAEMESYIMHNPNHKVIFTGGDAIFFVKKLKSPIFVIRNLVAVGLNHVLEYNLKS